MLDAKNAKKQYEEILQQLGSPELLSNWEKFEELSKEKSRLEKIVLEYDELQDLKNKIEENKEILKAREDGELISLAETEIKQLQEKEKAIERELAALLERASLAPLERENPSSVIIEIRAGAGGEEAALFAADLFKMYSKYALLKGWKQKILDSNQTGIGGFKEVIFELQGKDVWQKMQYEGGVHRVQRIPTTEKQGRVHTSTASVAVLPKPKETQVKINPSDLKVEVSKATGPGGQNVNKRMTAVRIVHLPSGIAVDSKTERKTQIGWAKRAEKIRTYNFPQDRVTDHRIKKSFHNIEGVMSGELNQIAEAIDKSD